MYYISVAVSVSISVEPWFQACHDYCIIVSSQLFEIIAIIAIGTCWSQAFRLLLHRVVHDFLETCHPVAVQLVASHKTTATNPVLMQEIICHLLLYLPLMLVNPFSLSLCSIQWNILHIERNLFHRHRSAELWSAFIN